jgi:hypothetical protein
MFGKLFGKKRQPANEDEWSVATAEDDGMPLIFRIRTVPSDLNRAGLPHLIAVSWPYQPADGGMPSPADKEQMDLLEDLLTPALEGNHDALLTVVATGNGVREWQWYSAVPDATMQLVNTALNGHPPFPVELSIQDDPDWAAYSQFE